MSHMHTDTDPFPAYPDAPVRLHVCADASFAWLLRARAREAGCSVSEIVRAAVMGHPPRRKALAQAQAQASERRPRGRPRKSAGEREIERLEKALAAWKGDDWGRARIGGELLEARMALAREDAREGDREKSTERNRPRDDDF